MIAVHQTGSEGNWGNKHSVRSADDDEWNKNLLTGPYNGTVLFKTTFLSPFRVRGTRRRS